MVNDVLWDIDRVRSCFPALAQCQDGRQVAFFDGPAGSQVPQCVANAVSDYLLQTNANRGATHSTSRESDRLLDNAHQVVADFLGALHQESIVFGANMTTLTLSASRALARQWSQGDEIIVSQLDHDANVTPWVLAAADAGAVVHHIRLSEENDWRLRLEDYYSRLSSRTKMVAVGFASNATGTINPVKDMVTAAREFGALTYVDAVHYAPHCRINVEDLGCDFLACSAYKFFGPHVGILYGRRELLEEIRPYKLRPSTNLLPGKWMTGTQNHEGIAGTTAAIEYLASLDNDAKSDGNECSESSAADRVAKLNRVFSRIREYEESLSAQFLQGVSSIPGLKIFGITDPAQLNDRVPTFSMTCDQKTPQELARALAEQGVFAWAGNHYALPFTEAAGLEPLGTLRIGALHYNSIEEINRVVDCLRTLLK